MSTIPLSTTEPVQSEDLPGRGYTIGPTVSGGRELTRAEARAHGLPVADQVSLPDPAQPPTYALGRVFTRDQMIDLFRASWNRGNIGAQDVEMFIRSHALRPVSYEPFPPLPDMPDDEHPSSDEMATKKKSS